MLSVCSTHPNLQYFLIRRLYPKNWWINGKEGSKQMCFSFLLWFVDWFYIGLPWKRTNHYWLSQNICGQVQKKVWHGGGGHSHTRFLERSCQAFLVRYSQAQHEEKFYLWNIYRPSTNTSVWWNCFRRAGWKAQSSPRKSAACSRKEKSSNAVCNNLQKQNLYQNQK